MSVICQPEKNVTERAVKGMYGCLSKGFPTASFPGEMSCPYRGTCSGSLVGSLNGGEANYVKIENAPPTTIIVLIRLFARCLKGTYSEEELPRDKELTGL